MTFERIYVVQTLTNRGFSVQATIFQEYSIYRYFINDFYHRY
jgi:hypothetical protein